MLAWLPHANSDHKRQSLPGMGSDKWTHWWQCSLNSDGFCLQCKCFFVNLICWVQCKWVDHQEWKFFANLEVFYERISAARHRMRTQTPPPKKTKSGRLKAQRNKWKPRQGCRYPWGCGPQCPFLQVTWTRCMTHVTCRSFRRKPDRQYPTGHLYKPLPWVCLAYSTTPYPTCAPSYSILCPALSWNISDLKSWLHRTVRKSPTHLHLRPPN